MMSLPGVPLPIRLTSQWRRHPEWWLLGLIAACWFVIAARHLPTVDHGNIAHPAMDMTGAMSPGHVHQEMGVSHNMTAQGTDLRGFFADWSVMTAAMMLPSTIPVFRQISFNSVRSRQVRSTVIFLVAYCAVWVGVGVGVVLMERVVSRLMPDRELVSSGPILLLLAAGWQVTPWKRRAVNACRRGVPLRPFGLRADLACGQYGLLHGWRCVTSCWLLMIAMVATGHGPGALLVMVGLTALAIAEELVLSRRQFLYRSAGLLVATSFVVLVI